MRLLTRHFAKMITNTNILTTEKQIEIKAPWGKIAAISWGEPSNPPILMCHGAFDACSTFRPLVSLLPKEYNYLSVDLPGYGHSTHLPKGMPVTIMDFLPTLARVRDHYKWEKFGFVGHSIGAALGKYYNIIYPGQITSIVELDPLAAYLPSNSDLRAWYLDTYEQFYSDEQYYKLNSGSENGPKYTYNEIKTRLMKARGLDENAVEFVLERSLEPTDDGLFRMTFDQRLKLKFLLPFSSETYKELYTTPRTPTLAILSTDCIDKGIYTPFPFVRDEGAWPHGNYKHFVLSGTHDIHLNSPGECAELIIDFLNGLSKKVSIS